MNCIVRNCESESGRLIIRLIKTSFGGEGYYLFRNFCTIIILLYWYVSLYFSLLLFHFIFYCKCTQFLA